MPITWETRDRIDRLLKPFGRQSWADTVLDIARGQLSARTDSVVLEAGCGRECWITRKLRQEGLKMRVLGVDVDKACLKNADVDEAMVGSLVDIPLESESVDLIMCGFVFEHLDNPDSAIRELARVLKPGGLFITWTTNKWNPTMVASALTSQHIHTFFRRMTWGVEHADNARTYYKLNTPAAIKMAASKAGLIKDYSGLFSYAYAYFQMTSFTYVAACVVNKLAAFWPLSKLRLVLLWTLRKPE